MERPGPATPRQLRGVGRNIEERPAAARAGHQRGRELSPQSCELASDLGGRLSGALTLASRVVSGLPLNCACIIAVPPVFGIGVALKVHFVVAWRDGETGLLRSSLAQSVVFSALTTATALHPPIVEPSRHPQHG